MVRARVSWLIAILLTTWALLGGSAAEARDPRPPRPPRVKRCHPGATCRHGTGVCNDAGRCCDTMDGDEACGSECCEFSNQACCDGQSCANLLDDSNNCGGCGIVCTGGKSCENGVCTCPNGGTDCGGTCTNVLFDDANCGACGNACAASEKCFLGTCGCSDPSQLYCDGQCIDGFADPNNCGRCGNVCPAGQDCIGGQCQPPCDDPCHELVNNVCVLKDPSKDTVCNGACVDLNSDQDNCGGCGNVCPAGQDCVDGACQSPRCAPPTFDCGGVWCCPEGQLCLNNDYTGAPLCCIPGFGRREECLRLGLPFICCMPQ